jgi:hypothetical protein
MFLNLLYTDAKLLNMLDWGIEGKHYVKVSDNVIDYPEGVTAESHGYPSPGGWMFGNQFNSYLWANEDPDKWEQFGKFNDSSERSIALGFTFDETPVKAELAAIGNVEKEFGAVLRAGAVDVEETIAKFEGIKAELLGRDEVNGAASTAWQAGKDVIEQMLDDPSSTLRTSIADAVVRLGVRIHDDQPLQDKMNTWIARIARHVAENYSTEIISVITDTVRGWDAEETSRKIELQVGRDLQFIRINGTVVGSLAGLAIYTISVLIF